MNIAKRFPSLGITNTKSLTEKKQQTDKKIQYVSAYVRLWAYVMLERPNTDTVNFIDCMSNAGVYRDGDCCTAIEVLRIFSELADDYPQKAFECSVTIMILSKSKSSRKLLAQILSRPKRMCISSSRKKMSMTTWQTWLVNLKL